MNKPQFFRIARIVIAIAAVVVLVYLAMIGTRIASGVSEMVPMPAESVRVQVLTVDAGEELAAEIGKWLKAQADSSFAIDVVETDRYELRSAARTLIVSRIEDETAARMLANRIGLDPSEVIYKPLEHNTNQATATLIVGSDFDRIRSLQQTTKELQKQS